MPNWKELSHAYGSAEDLPGIISALTPDPNAPAWDDLWSRVCHQGTTYSASPAVLPFLLLAASGWDARGRAMPLALAGAIVSAPQTTLSGHEPTVEALRVLALATVKGPELSRNDRIVVMHLSWRFKGTDCGAASWTASMMVSFPRCVRLAERISMSWSASTVFLSRRGNGSRILRLPG
jgi:hypothetical protein